MCRSAAARFALSLLLAGVLLMTAACAAPAQPQADRAGEPRLHFAAALRPWFAALRRLESGRLALPLRMLQIGDSHTAADALSGRLRTLLQQRFGAAGRGWLPAGIPFKYFNPRLVTVSETGWRHLAPASAGGLPLGLDATLAESAAPSAQMRLDSGEPEGFDRCAIEFLAEPQGAPLSVRIDGGPPRRVSTAAAAIGARRVTIPCGPGAHSLAVAASGRRPVRLLGWATARRRPGIIYENHGTIGARIGLIAAMSRQTIGLELADDRPALLVIAFGTNEGFDDALDLHDYAAGFRDHVRLLHRLAPRAAVLVLGPPDGLRLGAGCPAQGAPCADDGTIALPDACEWRAPPNLSAVRMIQKQVARDEGWAFWDWSAAMGGICSIHRLALRSPPWAFPDHIHLTRLGYEATADLLFDDLMAAYQGAATRRSGPR